MASSIAFPWRLAKPPLPPRVTTIFTCIYTSQVYPFVTSVSSSFVPSLIHSVKMKPPTEFFSSDDSDSDTPQKCRNRRRRRINMRRMRIASFPRVPPPRFHPPRLPVTPSVKNPMPEFGCISGLGNDAVFVKEEIFRPDIVGGMPLHIFAVYDGHGGSHVSEMCKKMMHKFMAEELTRVQVSEAAAATGGGYNCSLTDKNKKENEVTEEDDVDEWEDSLRVAVEKSFKRMDQVALSTCACGKTCYTCGYQPIDRAIAGSTAVVALVSRDHVVVANCGDSRAVLCRHGRPIPPFLGHKPERADELERIREEGGKLIYQKGVRVYCTRSLGDNFVKRVTTSQPDIFITKREAEDECLILASDGIWDVISDELACRVASECLREGSAAIAPARSTFSGRSIKYYGAQVLFPSKSNFAAAVLCRLALARGSHDNISVIVVDLNNKAKG